jgi:hypothetical protein
LGYILTATEFKQLFKVTSLLDHYSEHKAANTRISFFDFLYMHYAGDDLVDTDNDKDMELPFKKFDNVSSASSSSVPPGSHPTEIKQNQNNSSDWITPVPTDPFTGFSASIWQPPRLC